MAKQQVLSTCINGGRRMMPALLLSAVLLACAAPQSYRTITLDGSNAETTRHSVQRMLRLMPEQKKADFMLALVKIQVHSGQQQPAALLQGDAAMKHVNYRFIGQQTHGLTSSQIVAKAATLR